MKLFKRDKAVTWRGGLGKPAKPASQGHQTLSSIQGQHRKEHINKGRDFLLTVGASFGLQLSFFARMRFPIVSKKSSSSK